MMLDVIKDYETIGADVNKCPVVDCSYFVFDWARFTSDNPYSLVEILESAKKDKINVKDQIVRLGCSYTKADIDFWQNQGPTAMAMIAPKATDIKLEEYLDNFLTYVKQYKITHWWSRSNTFDPMILDRVATISGRRDELYNKLKYWNVRDTRTFIDAKFNFTQKPNAFVPVQDEVYWNNTFKAHNSTHDIAADILRMQTIMRAENDMEITIR